MTFLFGKTEKQKEAEDLKKEKWHKWFAWYPVVSGEEKGKYRIVWMQKVYRKIQNDVFGDKEKRYKLYPEDVIKEILTNGE